MSVFSIDSGNSVQIEMAIETEKDVYMRMMNLDEAPEKPEAPHERLWKNLSETPSTLIVKMDDKPYSYTKQNIETTFSSVAGIQIFDRCTLSMSANKSVSFEHRNEWYRNLNYSPFDPTVSSGNFSQSKVESTERLFLLEFGSRCAKQTQESIEEVALRVLVDSIKNKDLSAALFAATIKLATLNVVEREMTIQERIEFSIKLENTKDAYSVSNLLVGYALEKARLSERSDIPLFTNSNSANENKFSSMSVLNRLSRNSSDSSLSN